MPITCLNVTDIAHDDTWMEDQIQREVSRAELSGPGQTNIPKTGRKVVLDPDWSTPTTPTREPQSFLYRSDVEFILIKAPCEIKFQRILPIDNDDERTACISWNDRRGEQYYIFKVDPKQKVLVVGSLTFRFFRCPDEVPTASASEKSQLVWESETLVRPWEAEDVYRLRDVELDEVCLPEHLAEVGRRFEAWRARTTEGLFVYLMVPKSLMEAEWVGLLENGVQFFDDVPWIL